MSSTSIPKIVPAQLSFLAVYNPSLGPTDERFHEQIVVYYSKHGEGEGEGEHEHEHEKLRQVGLAQGMVAFAHTFSSGAAVDSVETHTSRIVLHELEAGWWVLAAVDLTQLPATTARESAAVEYSSREVSPPALLVQQLVRAHAVFHLHHGAPLDVMCAKYGRDKFCSIMDKYWARFAASWDVLLHGSPAVDVYGGIKLAAGGELGMGVGEEDWGSSERDVLEAFARRTDGLVDLIVSRFGRPSPLQQPNPAGSRPWMGSGRHVDASDGVVFSGLGALTRSSLRDLSHWAETIYSYGDQAYGVRDNPTSHRRKRKRRNLKPAPSPVPERLAASNIDSGLPPGIPPPIVKAADTSLDGANQESGQFLASLGDTESWMKYMTLGYGTAWGGKKADGSQPSPTPEPEAMRYIDPTPDLDHAQEKLKQQIRQENEGYFLVGLKGDMEELTNDDENDKGNWNNRIPLRTLHVEVNPGSDPSMSPSADSDETPMYEYELNLKRVPSHNKLSRLRPVVYVHRPFIYTFLFHHRTGLLSLSSFYRDIHNFFSPLHRSLDKSTSPEKVAARLSAAANPHTTVSSNSTSTANTQPIYDLVYDPRTLTIHSSLPNIPDPGTLIAEGLSSTSTHASSWSRLEALNVHSQILATVANTRRNLSEIERTCKTSRGWWVVWMRLPPSHVDQTTNEDAQSDHPEGTFNTDDLREAFLVRRARDTDPSSTKSSGSRFASGMWSLGMGGGGQSQRMGGKAAGWGPKGLAEGIGIDARRYVEDLLSLNR